MSEQQTGGAQNGASNNYNPYVQKRFIPSGFINFLASLIPGAGHMYQGLMSRGALLMIMFSISIMGMALFGSIRSNIITGILVGICVAAMIVIYFFAFFESMKTCRMIRMGLTESEELKLTGIDLSGLNLQDALSKRRGFTVLGIIMTILGSISIFSILADRYVSRDILQTYVWPAMEFLVPLAFVVIGLVLILRGRKAAKAQ